MLQQRRRDAEYAVGSCEFPVITEINKRKKGNFLKGGEDFWSRERGLNFILFGGKGGKCKGVWPCVEVSKQGTAVE